MQTKRTEHGHFRLIPLQALATSPTNPRQSFDPERLAQLAASIKERGVLQPILVRPNPRQNDKGKQFEIIAGERRFRASKLAKRAEIPARIVQMSDEEVLHVQIIENLQREDVHPLDEAAGFAHLKNSTGYAIAEIAQKVAKDARYVARRLALINLTPEAQADFRGDRLTLAHALELCRLTPEIQTEALAACFESRQIYDPEQQTWRRQLDRERPARHVRYLQEWIEQNVHLNLAKAAFKTDDARLRDDGLTCLACPHRSGSDTGLFHDIKNGQTCLQPLCYQAKLQTFMQIKRTEIEAKTGQPPAYISMRYGASGEGENVVGLHDYQVIEKRGVRCEYAEQAIYRDGEQVGRVKWICREPSCKDHLHRVPHAYSQPVNGNGNAASRSSGDSVEKRQARKQELFNIKIDETVRKRVFAEALKTYRWPLERAHLNEIVCEFFRRIPSDDQKTITEVFGFDTEQADKFRYDSETLLAELAQLTDTQLAQLMMLCSFAHYGSNQYGNRQVDQSGVTGLAAERGVNHALIDAEVRAEKAPKKYRTAHLVYLEAIKRGEPSVHKPVVFESSPQQQSERQWPSAVVSAPEAEVEEEVASKLADSMAKRAVKRKRSAAADERAHAA